MKKYKADCGWGNCRETLLGERNVRRAGEACMLAGMGAVVGSVATWFFGGGAKADRERKAVFIGLWVPSLFALSSYLNRKADEISSCGDFDEIPFDEELM